MSEFKIHPLQAARKKLGMKQHVLADLTGLSTPTIKRAERGEKVSSFTIAQLCDFFSTRWKRPVKPDDLGLIFEDNGNKHTNISKELLTSSHSNSCAN
jgi:transcriptional regulator with XRE-family HTH domain